MNEFVTMSESRTVTAHEIFNIIINRQDKINYEDNLEKYNKRLDKFNKILSEMSLCSESKLNAIITKIKMYVDDCGKARDKKRTVNKSFMNEILLPIVTFVGGVCFKSLKVEETFALGIMCILLIVYFKVVGNAISELLFGLINTTEIKMKKLLVELEDLYNREFL